MYKHIESLEIAKYLGKLDKSLTPQQAINDLCFSKHALLKDGYEELYQSLFRNPQYHYAIMTSLTTRWSGLTKSELATKLKVSNGHITKTLDELVSSGFVVEQIRFKNIKRESHFVATDFFSYFYNRWMAGKQKSINWEISSSTQNYAVCSGYAFEKLCHAHCAQIKTALGISGIPTTNHYWSYKAKSKGEKGAQIDLLLCHDNKSRNIELIVA